MKIQIVTFNRKQSYSIIMQCVVFMNLSIIDVCIGGPGRMHDAGFFQRTSLASNLESFTNQGEFHILGNMAYALSSSLITPYKRATPLTSQ